MAQWLGQFTGHTHATKVEGAEDSLRVAIEAFRSASSDEIRQKKAKAVTRLAKAVLTLRLKLLKALIASATEAQGSATLSRRFGEIETLKARDAKIRVGGLDAILGEFGMPSLPESPTRTSGPDGHGGGDG